MKRLLLILLFVTAATTLIAQTRTVRGMVRDENGQPLAGVKIEPINQSRHCTTQQNGYFSIKVDIHTSQIVASYNGYESQILDIDSSFLIFNLVAVRELSPYAETTKEEVVSPAETTTKETVSSAYRSVDTSSNRNNSTTEDTIVDDGEVMIKCQIMPRFQNGDIKTFIKWATNKLNNSSTVNRIGFQGVVTVEFIVNTNGNVSDIKIIKSQNVEIGNEVIHILKTSPKWTPGYHNNTPVRIKQVIPLEFR